MWARRRPRLLGRSFPLQLLVVGTLFVGPCLPAKGAADEDGQALIKACDLVAASSYDLARPADVVGMPPEQLKAKAAVAPCEAALKAAPDNPRIQYEMGRVYRYIGEFDKARELYEQAAKQGYAAAQVNLAAFYLTGLGGHPKDEAESARLYKLASDQGSGVAAFGLGSLYERGMGGLPKSDTEAVRLTKIAADTGYPPAQEYMANAYLEGKGGLTVDEAEALRLYMLAANEGLPKSQYLIAMSFMPGRVGVTKDPAENVHLLRSLVDRGVAIAEYQLGRLYNSGIEGLLPMNKTESVRLMNKAIDQGFVPSTRR